LCDRKTLAISYPESAPVVLKVTQPASHEPVVATDDPPAPAEGFHRSGYCCAVTPAAGERVHEEAARRKPADPHAYQGGIKRSACPVASAPGCL